MGSERLVFSSNFGVVFGHTYDASSCPMGSIVILVVLVVIVFAMK